MKLRLILTVASLLFSGSASAIVSMESLHLGSPQQGWSGQFQLGASGASGNTEKYDAAAGFRLQWHENDNTSFLVVNASYGRSAGTTNTDNHFVHIRHINAMSESWAAEGFLQQEENLFTRLEYRDLAGAGLRYALTMQDEDHVAYLGTGAMYVREKLLDPGVSEQALERIWRGNLYLVFRFQLGDHSSISSSTYYQPKLSDTDDFRALEDMALSVDINKSLALNVGINVSHDSLPPAGVEKTDTVYRTGISYKF